MNSRLDSGASTYAERTPTKVKNARNSHEDQFMPIAASNVYSATKRRMELASATTAKPVPVANTEIS